MMMKAAVQELAARAIAQALAPSLCGGQGPSQWHWHRQMNLNQPQEGHSALLIEEESPLVDRYHSLYLQVQHQAANTITNHSICSKDTKSTNAFQLCCPSVQNFEHMTNCKAVQYNLERE